VRWWLYGGDQRVNAYVDRYVAPAAAKLGVTVQRVPVADTADAVQRVLADRRAGRASGGAVDLIWVNGENFAAGKQAGLWLRDWVPRLPNSRALDLDDQLIARDLGVPIDGRRRPGAVPRSCSPPTRPGCRARRRASRSCWPTPRPTPAASPTRPRQTSPARRSSAR
jgi:hypothetical protein